MFRTFLLNVLSVVLYSRGGQPAAHMVCGARAVSGWRTEGTGSTAADEAGSRKKTSTLGGEHRAELISRLGREHGEGSRAAD